MMLMSQPSILPPTCGGTRTAVAKRLHRAVRHLGLLLLTVWSFSIQLLAHRCEDGECPGGSSIAARQEVGKKLVAAHVMPTGVMIRRLPLMF